jgi:hypothetical protein
MRTIADLRCHGTTGEPPLERFVRDEATTLRPLNGRPPFRQIRELLPKVHADCAVEVDTNAYSVPWRLIGETVEVTISGGQVRVFHAGQLVASHAEAHGRHRRLTDPAHSAGVTGFGTPPKQVEQGEAPVPKLPELLRPLAEYELLIGGQW